MAYLLCLGLIFGSLLMSSCSANCPIGFQKDGRTKNCTDFDECNETSTYCGYNTTCFNTVGGYYCQCETGFISTSTVNFTASTGQCRDINECDGGPDICGQNADCKNAIGSYNCTCKTGYSLSNQVFLVANKADCQDIDECNGTITYCGYNATCFNTVGSYYCQCKTGFTSTSKTVNFTVDTGGCRDIDECAANVSICGAGGTCHNQPGSYRCECRSGFYNHGDTKAPCIDLKCDQYILDSVTEQIPPNLGKDLEFLRSACWSLSTKTREGGMGDMLLETLLSIMDNLLSPGRLGDNKKVSKLLALVENTVRMVSPLLEEPGKQMMSSQAEVEILVNRSTVPPMGPVSLSSQYAKLDTHWDTAAGEIEEYPGFAFTYLLTYNNLEKSTNDFFHGMGNTSQVRGYQIISKVVTASVSNSNTRELPKPVTFDFSHTRVVQKGTPVCVFWNASLGAGGWSPVGCTTTRPNPSHTICSCTHLSSFAVLMALYDIEDPFELQLITWVGLSLSLLCLLLAIATFYFCKSIQGTRNTIHLHLCISLFVADLVFLAGISRTEDKGACAFVAGLLHFFFLSAFCWMCLEGVQLYRMVVLVFNTTLRTRYLLAAGYGIPAVIVAISASVNAKGYGTDRYCWLSLKDNFIWSFFGPICVIIVVNVFFFIITVWKLADKFSTLNPDLSNLRKIKTFTVTAIAQLCVLGTMWIFGCFQFERSTLVMSYLFTIFNSIQGVLVFVMHCLCSKQVREEYNKFLSSACRLQKYTEFSSSKSSNLQERSSGYTGESKI